MMYNTSYLANTDCINNGYFLGDWHWLVGVGFVVLITALILGFIAIGRRKHTNNDVIELLKMKFAQGEITEEEYLRRKKILSKK